MTERVDTFVGGYVIQSPPYQNQYEQRWHIGYYWFTPPEMGEIVTLVLQHEGRPLLEKIAAKMGFKIVEDK